MKTLRQWRKLWDAQMTKHSKKDIQKRRFLATIKLLREYTGDSESSVKTESYFLVSLKRFFTGFWNRHHALEIRNVLSLHMNECDDAFISRYTSIKDLIHPGPDPMQTCAMEIQKQLIHTAINPDGDLAKILDVIREKTGDTIAVKYAYNFDHVKAMFKDFKDMFKPYRFSESGHQFKRDRGQPVSGVDHIVKAGGAMIGALLVLVRNALKLVFFSRSHDKSWRSLAEDISDNAKLTITEPLAYFFDSIHLLVHGLSQIAATPLTYLLKIPFRGFLGLLQTDKEKYRTIEDRMQNNSSIQRLLHKAKNKKYDIKHIRSEVHRKYTKKLERGEKTSLKNESGLFIQAQYPQKSPEILLKSGNQRKTKGELDEYLQQFVKPRMCV